MRFFLRKELLKIRNPTSIITDFSFLLFKIGSNLQKRIAKHAHLGRVETQCIASLRKTAVAVMVQTFAKSATNIPHNAAPIKYQSTTVCKHCCKMCLLPSIEKVVLSLEVYV